MTPYLQEMRERWRERFPEARLSVQPLYGEAFNVEEHAIVEFIQAELARLGEEVVPEEKEIPTNELCDLVMALRDPSTLSEREKEWQKDRDLRLNNLHVAKASWDDCRSATLSRITERLGSEGV